MTEDPGPAGPRVPNEPEPAVDELAHRRQQRRADREVPCDLAAERALLSAALYEGADVAPIVAALPPEAWWGGPAHKIAGAIRALESEGQPVDAHTVASWLSADGQLLKVGGLPGLNAVLAEGGVSSSAQHYAQVILQRHRLRTVILAAEAAQDAAYNHQLELAVGCMASAIDDMPVVGDEVGDVDELTPRYLELLMAREAGETNAISTGMHDLDEVIGGLHPGNLVVVGARTGGGKTATLCQLAINLGKAGHRPLFVSLEMPWPELMDRWVGNIARINTRDLRRGEIGNAWTNVTSALDTVVNLGIRVAKPTTMTVPAIRSEARQHRADIVIVDYIQRVHAVGRRNANRENDVGEISRSLKGMALALDIPVVAAAQLNRNLEGRVVKKPELSDLRDSGQIEHDADVVVMVYRPSLHDDEADPTELDLIVRKNRHGELDTAHMTFLGPFQAVVSRAVAGPAAEHRTRSA